MTILYFWSNFTLSFGDRYQKIYERPKIVQKANTR